MTHYGLNKPTTPATGTNDYQYPTGQQMPYHGQEYDGYRFDATTGQWALVDPNETIAGKQAKKPISTKTAIWAVCGTAVVVLGLIGIANAVASDKGDDTLLPSSSSVTASTPDERFIEAYKDAGYTHVEGNSGILDAGYLVCDGFDAGLTERQIVSAGYSGNQDQNGTLERDDVAEIVHLATQYLCTEYN